MSIPAKAVIGAIMLRVSVASAASLYTETFDGSTAGWQDRDPGEMSVTNVTSGGNPGGCLRGRFPAVMVPTSPSDAFVTTGHLAAANFIGNYDEADAYLLGFDFMAGNKVPSSFRLSIFSGTNVIERFLTSAISSTGIWHLFRISLTSAELGRWGEDTHLFSSIITNVTRIEFQVVRNDVTQQSYFLDNIFLDQLPGAQDVVDQSGVTITWNHLRPGTTYQVEGSTNVNLSTWTPLESFVATNAVYQAMYPVTNHMTAFRIQIP